MNGTLLLSEAAHPGTYVHWGVVQISAANLSIVLAMIVLFVLALVVPFPSGRAKAAPGPTPVQEPRS